MKHSYKAVVWGAVVVAALMLALFLGYRLHYRMPLKEYTANALYMAVLDDEICRRELDGITEFPSKKESLQYKYHLFLEMNRKKSRKDIEREIQELEKRLNSLQEEKRDSAIPS